ncbi:MAG: hypothetical protein H7289_04715 [Mucilaginibacter sp.]|nr:hypothetical protein [Mucilaginibacter sp.]
MRRPLPIMILLVSIITGCKPDDSGFDQNAVNNSKSLLPGMWFVKAQIISGDTVKSFTAKDYYIFNIDNTFKYSSSSPDKVVDGRYTSTYQKLSFGADAKDNYTISKLTADSLIMYSTISGSAGGAVTVDKLIYKLARK